MVGCGKGSVGRGSDEAWRMGLVVKGRLPTPSCVYANDVRIILVHVQGIMVDIFGLLR